VKTPRSTRRKYLAALAAAGGASLAGCIDAGEGNDTNTTGPPPETTGPVTDETATTTDRGTASESADEFDEPTVETPAGAIRGYLDATVEADDPVVVQSYFHPIHPYHPDDYDVEEPSRWSRDDAPVSVETAVVDQAVTPDVVVESPVWQTTDVDRETVAETLDSEETAVVDATIELADGVTQSFRTATATADGNWRVLARGIPEESASTDPSPQVFDARVVETVVFDEGMDAARVLFVDSPVADSVTVRAVNAYSERSSSTPAQIEYFDVGLDPDGDAVVVTATVDGETRPVHREQYPESERVVDDVTYDTDADAEAFDATARVTFTDGQSDGTVTVSSTRRGSETTAELDGSTEPAVVGIEPDGDEIVVTRTDDETTAIHRERYRP
jgi:hypothetical protein